MGFPLPELHGDFRYPQVFPDWRQYFHSIRTISSTNLQGVAQLNRKRDDGGSPDERVPDGPNGGDSQMVLAYLKSRLADRTFEPDVIMLNCGLHDIKKGSKNSAMSRRW